MGSRIRKSVSPTGKAFSVIFSCVDPPAPVDIYNTNSPINARVAFDAIKQGEINETQETGLAGGEWELVLYEHTGQSRVNVMKTEDPEYGGNTFTASSTREARWSIGTHIWTPCGWWSKGKSPLPSRREAEQATVDIHQAAVSPCRLVEDRGIKLFFYLTRN